MKAERLAVEFCKQFGLSFQGPVLGEGPALWFNFTEQENGFHHKIGVRKTRDGLAIFDGDLSKSLGYIDLFYRRRPDCSTVTYGPHTQYVLDTPQQDDILGVVKYLEEGTVVSFEPGSGVIAKDRAGTDLYGIADPLLLAVLARSTMLKSPRRKPTSLDVKIRKLLRLKSPSKEELDTLEMLVDVLDHGQWCPVRLVSSAECTCLRSMALAYLRDHGREP
jgi:hypothetical protein